MALLLPSNMSPFVQVMHVAVLRQQHEVVQALLDFGFPLAVKNSRRWEPIDEAISLRDRAMVKLLLAAEVAAFKAEQKAKRAALLQTMWDLDDFTFKVGTRVVGLTPLMAVFCCL